MKFYLRLLFLMIVFINLLIAGSGEEIKITLTNGDQISGTLYEETSDSLFLESNYGILSFDKSEITDMSDTVSSEVNSSYSPKLEMKKYDQEARWRFIWSSMGIGSVLYGGGLPYVLGIEDEQVAGGMRMLLFAGGFYTSYKYSKDMDIPLGRWNFQMMGATLGAASILPFIATVGFENWFELDDEGKIMISYMMLATPYGIYKADQLYKKWDLTNGQASMISSAASLGVGNAIGMISFLHQDEWEFTQNHLRIYTLLTYSSALAGGYYTYKYVKDKSYTEDDVLFVNISNSVGLANALFLINALEMDSRQSISLMLVAGADAFTYFGNKMIQDVDLDKGQGRIIALGTYAGYLTWLGTAALLNIDYSSQFARIIDIASVSAGWYYSFKTVSKSERFKSDTGPSISITPVFQYENESIQPMMGLNITF